MCATTTVFTTDFCSDAYNSGLYPSEMETMAQRLERALLQKNGGNQSEMARYVGVSPQAVQKWISGESQPRGENLRKASEFLGVPAPILQFGDAGRIPLVPPVIADRITALNERRRNDVEDAPEIVASPKKLPIVGKVQAGPDGLLSIDDYPVGQGDGYVSYWTRCESAYALRVRGESMSPRYMPGEFVGVDPCSEVLPSDEVIVLLNDGRRLIKRLLWMRDGQACFESINKDFQNITFELEDISALHLVLGNIPKRAFTPD